MKDLKPRKEDGRIVALALELQGQLELPYTRVAEVLETPKKKRVKKRR